MSNLKIFCVTDKELDFLAESKYSIGWVGKEYHQKIHYLQQRQKYFFKRKTLLRINIPLLVLEK